MKKYFTNNTIFKYYMFIIIFQLLLTLIKNDNNNVCNKNSVGKCVKTDSTETSETSGCENYRTHFEGNECYNCSNGSEFYNIYSDGTCVDRTAEGCANKIIFETNECVGHCPSDYYELGDFCYSENSFNEANLNIKMNTDTPFKTCECANKKYNIITVTGGKKKYECLGVGARCNTGYYNLDTGECVTECNKNDKKYKEIISEGIVEIRCSSECENEEYLYKKNNTCFKDNCPEGTYIYEKENYGVKECLDECYKDDIYDNADKKCVTSCAEGEKIVYIIDQNKKKCSSESSSDIVFDDYIYEYNNIFFKECNHTKNLFNITTYKIIDSNDVKKCVEDCSLEETKYFVENGECVDTCDNFYYNKKCIENCSIVDDPNNKHDYHMDLIIIDNNEYTTTDTIEDNTNSIEIKFSQYPEVNECLEQCPSGTYIDKDDKICYISSCNKGKYINSSDLVCIDSCNGKIYNETAILEVITESDSPTTGVTHTYKIIRKYCLSSCPVSAPYYNYNESDCYDIPCKNRSLYSTYDNPYVCYTSCSSIPGEKKYNNVKDFICYGESNEITCDNYFYIENDVTQCATISQCLDKHYAYIKGKQCLKECGTNDYVIEEVKNNEGQTQNYGKCFAEAKECVNVNYIFIKNKKCYEKCENNYKTSTTNPIANENNDTCFDSCPSNYPFKDTVNKLCLMNCEKFFYKDECLDSCKENGTYHFEGSYECLDQCVINKTLYYTIDGDDEKLCYYNCPDGYYVKKRNESETGPYICVENCGTDSFYEDDKKCIDSCDIYKSNDFRECVHQCPQGEKVNEESGKFYCNSSCTNTSRPYILNKTLSEEKKIIVEMCVEQCPGDYLISSSTNYCLKECTFSESYKYNGSCYDKCPNNTFPNDIDKNCYDGPNVTCIGEFKYYEKDVNGNFRCKKTCYPGKYAYPEGGECMDSCPSDSYISYNNLCLNNCSGYGQYYKNNSNNYTCLSSCDGLILSTNECIEAEKCPDGYYISNNKCTQDCTSDNNKPFATIDKSGNKICAIQCNETQPNYGSDKKCKSGCGDSDENITNWDGKCVSNCTHPYYKYLQNGTCVNQCNEGAKISLGDKCVEKCESPYNYIQGNKCQTKCDDNQYAKTIEPDLFECVESCGDLYYYESGSIYNQKKCFERCKENDFIIQDTHICVSVCPSTHYSYFADKTNQDTTTPIYPNNTCVLKCPSDKPFLYLGKCVEECPTLYKYHIEGEYNCINDCPGKTYTDNEDKYTCKSYCPSDKYLDINKKDCIVKCPDSYKFHEKGVNECMKECNKSNYHIENDTVCVEHCSDGYYLFENNNTCLNSCQASNTYFVNIYDNNKCLEKCPENYPFYEYENIDGINYCKIKCDNVSDLNGTCLSKCEDSDSKYYNYKNMTCLNECPLYKEEISTGVYKCYDKCPSNKPYHNNSNDCIESCGDNLFTNLTSNDCQESCDKFSYQESTEKKFCLNECDELGLFQKGEKECVKNCQADGNNLIPNMATKKCECEKYYSIETNGSLICLNDEDINGDYKYNKYGTYQYLKNCSGYKYYDENTCYSEEDPLPSNIKKYDDGKIECVNKFYIDGTKICLNANDTCPLTHRFLIPETRQCVDTCNATKYIQKGNYCLDLTLCTEGNNFYINDKEINYNCTDNCGGDYPYLISELNQCVKDCDETEYYIFYDDKCYSTCNDFSNTIAKKVTRTINGKTKTVYECSCTSDLWYKGDDNKIKCNSDGKSTCEELAGDSKKLLVKDTKECVGECPTNYRYIFNDECYNSCSDVKKYYGYEMKTETETYGNECKCKHLWKSENNKIVCIEGNVCNEEGKKILVDGTFECVESCPGNNYTFNNTCYSSCPDMTEPKEDDVKTCICKNKWYKYEDKSLGISDIIICLEECPKDFYPFLDNEARECLENINNCTDRNKKIFNNICYNECPSSLNTKEKGDGSPYCECDKDKGLWQKYSSKDRIIYECGLNKCPGEKNYIDFDTNECLYACGNKYHFLKETQDYCYSSCPGNTALVDEISKECVEIINFDNPSDLKTLDEKVIDNIKEIYPKASKGGLVYSVNNSTLQIYGVNKNKTEKQDLIMRNNLTYIDLGNCIDKIYEKNSLSEDTDIIIVKYDIASSNSLIKPVEYKIINSKTGEEIPLDACEDNSIVISYPLSDILKNFATEYNLRNLEENKNNNNLNLREKFSKGKELNLEDNKIDSFNYNNKLYSDICYPLKLNGKDVILEDRFNYLYPLFSFCESNCLYDRTDFTTERVYCNCSPKDGVNFERNFELLDTKANINDVKKKQKGSILKCLGKISDIGKNFGFWYGFIILLVEIAMVLLTIFYSYKVYIMRIKKRIDLDVNKTNNIDTENIESMNLSEAKRDKNNNEEIIKTSERNLESQNPPKRKTSKLMTNIEEDDKKRDNLKKRSPQGEKNNEIEDPEVLNIKTTKKNNKELKEEKISSANSYNLYFGKSSENISIKEMDDDDNIFDLIILEQKKLTIDYDLALKTNRAEILIMIITEILDKIYLIKAIWFLTKYELFTIYFSLYLLWHMLIISFLSLFYNNSTLHKIWIKDNYPNLNFHLSFGFLSCIISFIIYKGLYILVNNEKKIKEIESIAKENKDEINAKYKNMMFWHQIKIIIFYAIEFIFVFLFFLYLTAFCGVYANAKAKLIESYGIALIEVVIIKILYGLVLGILRKVSLAYKINILYRIVQFLDLYIA